MTGCQLACLSICLSVSVSVFVTAHEQETANQHKQDHAQPPFERAPGYRLRHGQSANHSKHGRFTGIPCTYFWHFCSTFQASFRGSSIEKTDNKFEKTVWKNIFYSLLAPVKGLVGAYYPHICFDLSLTKSNPRNLPKIQNKNENNSQNFLLIFNRTSKTSFT